jgi:hypothetical protein
MTRVFSRLFAAVALTLSCAANAQTPPTAVPQADGTIQLVPPPGATVIVPYFIDPTMAYQVKVESNSATKDWDGKARNGQVAVKGSVVEVSILAMPVAKTKVVDGKTVAMWSIFRSADLVVTWDNTKLELLPVSAPGFGFDPAVFNAAKIGFPASSPLNEAALPADGNALFHAEVLPAPQDRTPALKPLYYQWNLNGYMWSSAYRLLGKLQFRVKGDFYYPTRLTTDVKVVPALTVGGVEHKSKVDGSPTVGTNILGEVRSGANGITFGPGPEHKVSHRLSAQTTKYKVGDTVPVQVLVKNEAGPQVISSVYTIFGWDPAKLEFMGIDKTGARASTMSAVGWPGAGTVNEVAVPKDGNAAHTWLALLGDKSFIDKENLIVTLNFKVVADFSTTEVKLLVNSDPSLAGLTIIDDCGILGSSLAGSFVTGARSGAVVNGVLP